MLTEIESTGLTETETKIYKLNGVGLQNKETAQILGITVETVKTHIKNIKTKIRYYKDKELTAIYLCGLFGESFEDVRKQVISSCLLLIFLISIPIEYDKEQRQTERSRIETRTKGGRRNGNFD